jgi:hypothetical protein
MARSLLQVARTLRTRLHTSDGADELSPAELLVNADIAMHDAKEAGHDRIMLQRPTGRPPGWRAKPTPVSLGVTFPGDLKTRRTKR